MHLRRQNSISIVNQNESLPPLLLPNLKDSSTTELKVDAERVSTISTFPVPNQDRRFLNRLDKLATVAMTNVIIRADNDTILPMKKEVHSKQLPITPPQTAPVSTTISPSTTHANLGSKKLRSKKIDTKSLHKKLSKRKNSSGDNKRQRIGPSCDNCRSKKIKCNATISVLLQDEKVFHSLTPKLHHILTTQEIEKIESSEQLEIPKEVYDESNSANIIKHLDKIVFFKPCSSCTKRTKPSSDRNDRFNCIFSKGFTRQDINQINKISKVSKKHKTIFEMTVEDYELTRL